MKQEVKSRLDCMDVSADKQSEIVKPQNLAR